MKNMIPWCVEFDEDVRELRDNPGEVLVGENEDVVFFCVGLGEEDKAK